MYSIFEKNKLKNMRQKEDLYELLRFFFANQIINFLPIFNIFYS